MSYDPDSYPSAWKGHFEFAHWLVQTMNPNLVVELGVDYGHSLIELARYNNGETHGIDWFQGDPQTGERNTEEIALQNVKESGVEGVFIHKANFNEAVYGFHSESIDILHIDGQHVYFNVKDDLVAWWEKVRPGGVILLHDTDSFPDDVGRLYSELKYPKFNFTHSAGLGVITKPWR